MIHYVIDASALVDLLTGAAPNGWLRRAVARYGCAAPTSIDLDAACLLGRLVEAGALPDAEAAEVLHDLRDAPLRRLDPTPLMTRAWSLRAHVDQRAAIYLCLAEALDVSLMTSDRRLESVPGHRARVHLVNGRN